MDLEVFGRHALLFDDDASAAFVNSGEALVDWHSLQIDRYDVRHLLSGPPPSRRRNRNSEPILFDDPSLESKLDHERYTDLPVDSDQPDVEEDENEKPLDTGGYRAVAFSYGTTDESISQKNTDAGAESSGFLPPFPIPENLVKSLPSTEKLHQIIARTALFVNKNGGQSEIILRVKQGDNPTFGFLLPDHHLHAYFRFLVENPQLLRSENDGQSHGEAKKLESEQNDKIGVGGALSLLGSVYGEEEDFDDNAKTEKDEKMEPKADESKDDSVSKIPALSFKEKIRGVKKNSLITALKSGNGKGIKKEEEKGSLFIAEKAKSFAIEIIEPPTEVKRLIDKLVEFIVRNGKQFEATVMEQDTKNGRFQFLLPSNQYHTYYLKVLQTAQESKVNGKNLIKRAASVPKESNFSSLSSSVREVPMESDKKEKFKMVINKSKSEEQETPQSKETQQVPVDAASAVAILQAAIRGTKTITGTSPEADDSDAHLTEEQKRKAERLKRAKMFVASLKSGSVPLKTGITRGSSEPLESRVTKEREGSLAPADIEKPEINYFGEENSKRDSKRKYRSKNGECEEDENENAEDSDQKHHRRRHRSHSYSDGDEDHKHSKSVHIYKDEKGHKRSRNKHHSRHSSSDEDEDLENIDEVRDHKHSKSVHIYKDEKGHKRSRKKHHSHHSSSDEDEDQKSNEEDKDNKNSELMHRYKDEKGHKPSRKKHRSYHSSSDEEEDKHSKSKHGSKEEKGHKRSRKKHHRSHYSSRKRRSSKQYSHEEDENDDSESDEKHSRKKHHSRRSSHHSRHGHSSRDKESSYHIKHDSFLDESHRKEDEFQEGKISYRVPDESREIVSGDIRRENSADVLSSSHQRAPSQPSESTAEVSDDLRAKIRAMLMATRV